MKAVVLEHINEPLTVSEVGLTSLRSGQVQVRMLVSGICGAQLQEIAGLKGNARFVPHLLGHEGCGIVVSVGPGVKTVHPGDKVILHWRKGEGIESDFPQFVFQGREIQSGKVTTFSEYTIVSENRVTAVPPDVPTDLCALLGCGLSTALGSVVDVARVQPGEQVLIMGLGGLGACAVKAAQLARAGLIVVADIFEEKRALADRLGVDVFINVRTEELAHVVAAKLGIKGFDAIIETSGSAQAASSAIPLLVGGGRCVFIGQPKPNETIEITNARHLFDGEGKMICATQGGGFVPHRDIPQYISWFKQGRLTIDNLISHRIKLDDINTAIQHMQSGTASRIMIDI